MERSHKTAIALAWNFFSGNYALNFATLAILIVLNLLGIIPFVGLLFIFGYTILSLSIQIYFGRKVLEIDDPAKMREVAAQTKIGEFLTEYLPQAAGAFLAFFVITVLLSFLFGTIFALLGGSGMVLDPQMMERDLQKEVVVFGIPVIIMLLLGGLLTYFLPAVLGRVIKSEDFVEAFKSAFLLFSPSLWRRCFNRRYFLFVLIWSLIMIVVAILMVIMSATLVLLPLVLLLAYLVSLYNAAVYVFAEELAS